MIRNANLHHAVDYTPYEKEGLRRAWPGVTIARGEGGLGREFHPRAGRGTFLPPVVAAADKARGRMTRLFGLQLPNISDSVSELIRAEALRSVAEGTTVDVLTAPFGVAYIETRFEALIGAYAAAQLAAEHHARFRNAVIVAAFGDPGLAGLREVLPIPVMGLTEAALASAYRLATASLLSPSAAASRPVPRGRRVVWIRFRLGEHPPPTGRSRASAASRTTTRRHCKHSPRGPSTKTAPRSSFSREHRWRAWRG